MEVKINKEIREYTENIYLGLTLRQFIFSLFACVIAGLTYFFIKKYLGTELTSWLCVIEAVPFVAFGFIKINGMKMEEFLFVYFKNKIFTPKILLYKPVNLYEELIKGDDLNVQNKKDRKRKHKDS